MRFGTIQVSGEMFSSSEKGQQRGMSGTAASLVGVYYPSHLPPRRQHGTIRCSTVQTIGPCREHQKKGPTARCAGQFQNARARVQTCHMHPQSCGCYRLWTHTHTKHRSKMKQVGTAMLTDVGSVLVLGPQNGNQAGLQSCKG